MNPSEKKLNDEGSKDQKPELTEEEIERKIAMIHKLIEQQDSTVISQTMREFEEHLKSWDFDNNVDEDASDEQ